MDAPEVHPSARVVGAVYGQILATAIVATLSEDSAASASEIFFGVAVAMLVFWLAHVYAEAVAVRLDRDQPLTVPEVWRVAVQEWPEAQAAIPALAALGLGWVGVLTRDAATDLAIALGVVALFGWGFLIARRSRLSPWGTAGAVALNGGFGLAIVALKVIVH
ncbi:MAG TPA: hypothetical protein VKB17_00465 [Thermoleophilaceae bacterium]|nr:hypothetical protein [Thermoleophilaceae bacterium]